jgi:integrase
VAVAAPDEFVFPAARGGPLRHGNFRRRVWEPAVAESGVAEDLVMHDLRDTAASLMIASGASIVAVARALGHADPSVTLRVYAGLYEEDLEVLTDRLEERWAAARDAQVLHNEASVVPFPK